MVAHARQSWPTGAERRRLRHQGRSEVVVRHLQRSGCPIADRAPQPGMRAGIRKVTMRGVQG